MDFSFQTITKNAKETAKLGEEMGIEFITMNLEPRTICLYGELGSGKTTFVQGFAKGLGIATRLLSPTFIIVRRYHLSQKFSFLYHLDLYRPEGVKDLETLGVPEILADTSCLVVIEWAEKLGPLLPKNRIDIHFETLDNGDHKIIWQKHQSK